MIIRINGADADIKLETEKNVGEILAGLEQWLANSGHRLSGLSINGQTISSGLLEISFERDIGSIETLDIVTSSLTELIAESLCNVLQDIAEYETCGFEEKQRFAEQWDKSPQARLLAEELREIFNLSVKTFSGEDLSPEGLRPIIEERLRELQDPAGELGRVEPLITEICVRLEDLPLDIQTGKDTRAAETMQFFSGIAEKVFRLFYLLKAEGFPLEELKAANTSDGAIPVAAYVTEFNAALKEMLAAYEQRDTVLVGDLAEYELAPRLRELYATLSAPIITGGPRL